MTGHWSPLYLNLQCTTLEKQRDLFRPSQVRLHPAETWGSSTSYVSRLQTRGFTIHCFWLHLNEMQERCRLNELNVCLCHAGSRPIAGLPAEHRAQEDKRRVQEFWGDDAKVCLFYEGHFDCELLNGQNDNCKSGTDASDGNDLSTTVVVTLSLPLFWHCLLKKKCPMSIKEVKCPKVLTCRLLSRKRLNLIKCYKFTFLLHLCFSERSSVRPRL